MPVEAPTVSYRPGDWMAVLGPGVWLLVEGRPDEPLLQQSWDAARAPDAAAKIERLVRNELATSARCLVLAATDAGNLVVLLSGDAVAETVTGTNRQMRCPAGVSIAEYRLAENPSHLVLRGGTAAEHTDFPIESGIARAAEVRLDWSAREHEDEGTGPMSEAVSSPGEPVAVDPGLTLLPPSIQLLEEPGLEPAETRDVAVVESPGETEDGYDHLFGHTVSRTVEEAAVRVDEPIALVSEPARPLPLATPPARLPAPEPPQPLPTATATHSVIRASSSGLIDEVPWVPNGGAPAPAPSTGDEGDLGLTVSRAAQKALLDQMSAIPANPIGPTVHAVRCPGQHPNPAHAETCRVCGATIDEQAPVTVPRPVLGRLRLSTGDEVSLDRGVLMGRGPTAGRQVGGERPHVVKFPSPGHDISRNHLEVRLDGWHVLVTDLNSTNGTLIARPGRPPERLRPDQPTMIEPGTVVTLADDVSFTFEVA